MSRVKMLIHRGTGGQQGGIYSIKHICPCIPHYTYKDPVKVIVDGNCNNSDWKYMPNEEQGKSESR